MDIHGYITLATILFMAVALLMNVAAPVTIIFSSLCLLIFTGVVTPDQALAGFSNSGLFIIACLFVIVGTVQATGSLSFIIHSFLGPQKSYRKGLAKLLGPTAFLSAFLNNTSIVLIFSSIVRKWAISNKMAPSKFLIPLSYAAIMGGTCTLIGTTTNLVVNGMLIQDGFRSFGMFELSIIAIPCTLVCFLYLLFFGNQLLPSREDPLSKTVTEDYRDFVLEALVEPNCPLVGLTIRQANLRHLSGVFLAKIERNNEFIGPVSSQEILKAKDRLIFIGEIHSVHELQEIPNLKILSDIHYPEEWQRENNILVEAVVSDTSPVSNKTVKEVDFRALYGAVVLAVHRNGERIESKIGDIRLRHGDILLLDTKEDFIVKYGQSRDFYLLSKFDEKKTFNLKKFIISFSTLLFIVIFAAFKPEMLLILCLAAIPFLFLTKCVNRTMIHKVMNWQILVLIASAFGIGKAFEISGAAQFLATSVVSFTQTIGPIGLLAGLYFITVIFATFTTNIAAAVLVFPVAVFSAQSIGMDPRPFIIATTLAASANFSSPVSYQCNMIVYGPGGYRFTDFLKIGVPLNILIGITTIVLVGYLWKLF